MKTIFSFALLAALAVAASANPEGSKMWEACGNDVERFCKGAPNPGMCLHQHWNQISPRCREFKEAMQQRWKGGRGEGEEGSSGGAQACAADKQRLCAGAPDAGRCLHENWESLSEGCRDHKEQMKKQWQAKKQQSGGGDPCARSKEELCAGMDDVGKCLLEHWDNLPEACRQAKGKMKAHWDQKKGQAQGPDACAKDVKMYCEGVVEVGKCLHENMDRLGEDCRALKQKMAQGGHGPKQQPKTEKGGSN